MKLTQAISMIFVLAALILAAAARTKAGNDKDAPAPAANSAISHTAQDDTMRLEGERRFHANCGRCHAAPPRFRQRMMATIIRHMRVRATITDEDMRLILHYMTD